MQKLYFRGFLFQDCWKRQKPEMTGWLFTLLLNLSPFVREKWFLSLLCDFLISTDIHFLISTDIRISLYGWGDVPVRDSADRVVLDRNYLLAGMSMVPFTEITWKASWRQFQSLACQDGDQNWPSNRNWFPHCQALNHIVKGWKRYHRPVPPRLPRRSKND